jgi:hypothetical protein
MTECCERGAASLSLLNLEPVQLPIGPMAETSPSKRLLLARSHDIWRERMRLPAQWATTEGWDVGFLDASGRQKTLPKVMRAPPSAYRLLICHAQPSNRTNMARPPPLRPTGGYPDFCLHVR